MPQTVTRYRIFVASPNDVFDERNSLNHVVDELNRTFGNQTSIVIEVIKWETHSAPAVSFAGTQDIINKDIGEDYDLFIGILWKKFGTPTDKADSGTEEEFNLAFERYTKNPSSIQILFYFKTASPSSLSEINPEQLSKVQHFKSRLGEKGVLYWEFIGIDELSQFLRIHIPKRISQLIEMNKNEQSALDVKVVETCAPVEDELGVFDYQEMMSEYFESSFHALQEITNATEWVGIEISKRATEIQILNATNKEIGKKTLRDFFRRTASVLNDFAKRIEPEVPIFIDNFEMGADAFSKMATIYKVDFTSKYETEIEEADNSLDKLIVGIRGGIKGMSSFLDSVKSLQRMEKELTAAKRLVEQRLGDFIGKLEVSLDITYELKKNLRR